MKLKYSVRGRIVGVWLAMVFVGGCATPPPGRAERGPDREVNGTSYWNLASFEGADDLSNESYYYRRTTTNANGLTYEESGYYLYITHPPGGASDVSFKWNYPPPPGAAKRSGSTDPIGHYGWYALITHPPGGGSGYVVCGTNAVITHPPGGKPADRSK